MILHGLIGSWGTRTPCTPGSEDHQLGPLFFYVAMDGLWA